MACFPSLSTLVAHHPNAALHTNTVERSKDGKKQTGKSKTRRMPEAFAAHLRQRHVALTSLDQPITVAATT